jgi:hypothetical protein
MWYRLCRYPGTGTPVVVVTVHYSSSAPSSTYYMYVCTHYICGTGTVY